MTNSNVALNSYIDQVIGKGDEGSALLAKLTAPSLKNCKYVDVVNPGMNGLAVLKNLPNDYDVVVYSVGGDPKVRDLANYAESLVHRLVHVAKHNDFIPLAFANVVDARHGEKADLEIIGKALKNMSDEYGLAIMNGELAILGDMVNCTANINGTMIALAKKSDIVFESPFMIEGLGGHVQVASFDHQGKPVYINSDGEGTKCEFEIRTGTYSNGLLNSAAMKLDDLIKIGAEAKVVSDVIQTKGDIPIDEMRKFAEILSKRFGIQYIIEQEKAADRIRGYNITAPAFNISGSSVSLIDEYRLRNPLTPQEGEFIVAIRGHPNPRSNGITAKRRLMVEWLGENYHETEKGKEFLQYLAAPSIVFYPHFKELIDADLVTSVYHMSGGAYNGKLARPLAKHNFFANLTNLFEPDYREIELMKKQNISIKDAYAMWPMGNDAFVTTAYPDAVISYLEKQGLEGNIAAVVENRFGAKTGIELTAFNGEKVYYPGK